MHKFPRQGQSGSGFLPSCGPARFNGDATAMVAPAKPGGSARTERSGATPVSALSGNVVERGGEGVSGGGGSVPSGSLGVSFGKYFADASDNDPVGEGRVHRAHDGLQQDAAVLVQASNHRSSSLSKKSNLDATGMRVVCKGARVQWSAWPMRVQRVRLGVAYCRVEGLFGGLRDGIEVIDCSQLRVVA